MYLTHKILLHEILSQLTCANLPMMNANLFATRANLPAARAVYLLPTTCDLR